MQDLDVSDLRRLLDFLIMILGQRESSPENLEVWLKDHPAEKFLWETGLSSMINRVKTLTVFFIFFLFVVNGG